MTIVTAHPHTRIPVSGGHSVALSGQLFDPVVASAWLADYLYPRQRPSYPTVIQLYAQIMGEGKWRVSTLMLCEYVAEEPAEPTPENPEPLRPGLYLLNGRNRLSAVVEAGATIFFLIEHHRVEAEEDVHGLYQIQDRGRTRSVSDVFKAMGLDNELGMSVHTLRMLGEAERYFEQAFNAQRNHTIDPYQRAQFVRDWRVEGRAWLDCLAGSSSRMRPYVTTSPVTAVAMATLRGQPERAREFWSRVAHNDGLRAGSPEHTLINWLYTTRVREMPEHHYARHIAAAWNAWFVGNTLERLISRDLDGPINIIGTEWERRRMQRRRPLANGEENGDDDGEGTDAL